MHEESTYATWLGKPGNCGKQLEAASQSPLKAEPSTIQGGYDGQARPDPTQLEGLMLIASMQIPQKESLDEHSTGFV